jgi:hypothetical protein
VFDLISGVLRNLQPLKERPRMADWADIASALYAHLGWGRTQFTEDWRAAEEHQYDVALDRLPSYFSTVPLGGAPGGVAPVPCIPHPLALSSPTEYYLEM